MKILHRITKLDKKEDGYYPATVEFGICDECSKELDPSERAYLLDGKEYLICQKCYQRRKEN